MKLLIGLVVFFCVFGLPTVIRNYKFNNRISPDGFKTDWTGMNHDTAMGKSETEIKQKFIRGGYDVRDKN